MNNETQQSQLYLDSILLFIVKHILALIIDHHQVLLKIREEGTQIQDIIITPIGSQPSSVYKCCYCIKAETV
jgi:hypothetical protein